MAQRGRRACGLARWRCAVARLAGPRTRPMLGHDRYAMAGRCCRACWPDRGRPVVVDSGATALPRGGVAGASLRSAWWALRYRLGLAWRRHDRGLAHGEECAWPAAQQGLVVTVFSLEDGEKRKEGEKIEALQVRFHHHMSSTSTKSHIKTI